MQLASARGGRAPVEAELERCAHGPARDDCLRGAYERVAEHGNVAETLVALQSLSRRGVIDDCHLEAHRLAHAVVRAVGDVERTFLLAGPQCRLGYLHGAVEASAQSVEPHALPLPDCGRLPVPLHRRACAHGYGHALMAARGHDVAASLDGCRVAGRRGLDRDSCERGVLMENALRYAGRRDYAVASARGCAAVADAPRLSALCFDNVGVVAALATGHDPVRATAACRPLPRGPARANCLVGAREEIAEARRER